MGRLLKQHGVVPQLALSSDSRRTTETVHAVALSFPEMAIRFESSLYHAGLSAVRSLLPSVPKHVSTLLLVGHNPGWEELVTELSGRPTEMKTAYAAVLEAHAPDFVTAVGKGRRLTLAQLIKPR